MQTMIMGSGVPGDERADRVTHRSRLATSRRPGKYTLLTVYVWPFYHCRWVDSCVIMWLSLYHRYEHIYSAANVRGRIVINSIETLFTA